MEGMNPVDALGASVLRGAPSTESLQAHGLFVADGLRAKPSRVAAYLAAQAVYADLYRKSVEPGASLDLMVERERARLRIYDDADVRWQETFHNLVTTEGKNYMLDNFLAGSGFTQTGPYIGLISSVSYTTGPQAADTAAQINGTNAWKEAGNSARAPEWSTPATNARATPAWSAAANGSKAISSAVAFVIATTAGTVKGAIMVLGASAVTTNGSTAGKLFSAGTFSGGDKIVAVADTLNVSWSLGL